MRFIDYTIKWYDYPRYAFRWLKSMLSGDQAVTWYLYLIDRCFFERSLVARRAYFVMAASTKALREPSQIAGMVQAITGEITTAEEVVSALEELKRSGLLNETLRPISQIAVITEE